MCVCARAYNSPLVVEQDVLEQENKKADRNLPQIFESRMLYLTTDFQTRGNRFHANCTTKCKLTV